MYQLEFGVYAEDLPSEVLALNERKTNRTVIKEIPSGAEVTISSLDGNSKPMGLQKGYKVLYSDLGDEDIAIPKEDMDSKRKKLEKGDPLKLNSNRDFLPPDWTKPVLEYYEGFPDCFISKL